MMDHPAIAIRPARFPDDLDTVVAIFQEDVRRLQAGRQLVERMLQEARQAGYARMCLDVLPEFQAARALYASLGFADAAPVSHNPVPGTSFLALDLRA